MQSLKEIRNRINSITSTQKITGALKMISAAKFHKAIEIYTKRRTFSDRIINAVHYIGSTIKTEDEFYTKWFLAPETYGKVALVVFTSNSSMCGGFNQNLLKFVSENMQLSPAIDWKSQADIFCLGKKGDEFFKKREYNVVHSDVDMVNNPEVDSADALMVSLIEKYLSKQYDAVFIAYNEFKNPAVQEPTIKQLLPFPLEVYAGEEEKNLDSRQIFEPTKEQVLEDILPWAIRNLFFQILLENAAGEHGARMTSMHQATENAIELNKELKLQYNKARQASITNEILEIVSGAEALKG